MSADSRPAPDPDIDSRPAPDPDIDSRPGPSAGGAPGLGLGLGLGLELGPDPRPVVVPASADPLLVVSRASSGVSSFQPHETSGVFSPQLSSAAYWLPDTPAELRDRLEHWPLATIIYELHAASGCDVHDCHTAVVARAAETWREWPFEPRRRWPRIRARRPYWGRGEPWRRAWLHGTPLDRWRHTWYGWRGQGGDIIQYLPHLLVAL